MKELPKPITPALIALLACLGLRDVVEQYSRSHERAKFTDEQEAELSALGDRMQEWLNQKLAEIKAGIPSFPMEDSEEDNNFEKDDPVILEVIRLLPRMLDEEGIPR